jgi:acetyl-CoA acetyltransferase
MTKCFKAPVNAVEELLAKSGVDKSKIARWEVNEAFSITAIAFIKHFGLDPKTVNANGGAVALGMWFCEVFVPSSFYVEIDR